VRTEVAEQAPEIKRLKRELARVNDERTILKKATIALTGRALHSNVPRGNFARASQ